MVAEDAAGAWNSGVHGALYLEKAFLTPRGSPRILQEPVVSLAGSISAITDQKNSMVDHCATLIRIDDSRFVEEEVARSRIYSN